MIKKRHHPPSERQKQQAEILRKLLTDPWPRNVRRGNPNNATLTTVNDYGDLVKYEQLTKVVKETIGMKKFLKLTPEEQHEFHMKHCPEDAGA